MPGPLVIWLIKFVKASKEKGMSTYLDKTASLSPAIKRILCEKATEYPHSGRYNEVVTQGTYLCRRCGAALYRGSYQFNAGCGWPSFDAELAQAVGRKQDEDGNRVEIVCAQCEGHLGHVFMGEYLTSKNLRHCVNSASLDFVEDSSVLNTEEAIVAGGCFWGVEFYLKQIPGVLKVESGYTGGHVLDPSYDQICQGNSGHYEAVRVLYDVNKVNYKNILKRFFEIHDPTQTNGQGPDLGHQYQSAVFYYDKNQQAIAESLIQELKQKGYSVVTQLFKAQVFWPAEDYHQNYYGKKVALPYCHHPVHRFT